MSKIFNSLIHLIQYNKLKEIDKIKLHSDIQLNKTTN